ncbi:MAG: hypothetical protein LBT00_14620 [Spirochaetaceae bacterium]|nr:hypothetical protein [Spirochaetaceae bacterium]
MRGARRRSNPVKKGSHPGLLRCARNDEAHQIHLFVSVRGRVVIARRRQLAVSDKAIQSRKVPPWIASLRSQ